MRKTLFIVEGQTEQVFVSKFLEHLVALAQYSLTLVKLHGGELINVGQRGFPEDVATHHIRIVDVGNDEKVNSFISENVEEFKRKGFDSVFGLRDRFTGSSTRKPINPEAVDSFAKNLEKTFDIQVGITIAIEELEAWFLLVPEFFMCYSTALTNEKISNVLGFDIQDTDVETITHPAQTISKILKSVGLDYKKRLDDSYKIAEAIDYETLYLQKTLINPTLKKFVDQLESALP